MPLSEKQEAHLKRLEELPQVRRARFQRGHKPWNYGTEVIVSRKCQFCGKSFLIRETQLKRDRGIYCSQICFYNSRKKYGVRAQIKTLYEQGKTYKEIGQILGKDPANIAGQIYRMGIANRFGDGIFSKASRDKIKTLLAKQGITNCELCGYQRVIEVAHITERKNGGKYLLDNSILLCPNCHHLFDHKLLTWQEKAKIKKISRLNGNLARRLQ